MSLSPSSTLFDETAFDSPFYTQKALLSYSDSSMSLSGDFSFLTGVTQTNSFDSSIPTLLPSLLPDNALDFDLGPTSQDSPQSDRTFDSFATPTSASLLSPKSNFSTFTPSSNVFNDTAAYPALEQDQIASLASAEYSAIIASYEHHQSRYLLYQAYALQAEQNVRINQVQIDNLLSFSMSAGCKGSNEQSNSSTEQAQPFYGVTDSSALSFTVATQQQAQATAASMHAQAQVHMQARDVALARAQQHRSLSMNYYLPSQRGAFDHVAPGQPMWSRHSVSSVASPPFPSTPNYAQESLPLTMAKTVSSVSLPNVHSAALNSFSQPTSEGENEVDDESSEENEDDEESFPGMPVANPHGGGRGYIPGKTPDDPKKKHKCNVCGRGFARAFNLKVSSTPHVVVLADSQSHAQTHNPMRSKPHQCPHPTCKRGFSRLHDLERHRQGIHSDGPLVDAKRHGVPPAIARAQNRIQRRSESSQRTI